MGRAIIISADCHATAPRELFTEYLPARWRDEHAAYAVAHRDEPHAFNPHPAGAPASPPCCSTTSTRPWPCCTRRPTTG
jgi:hypothetical protein